MGDKKKPKPTPKIDTKKPKLKIPKLKSKAGLLMTLVGAPKKAYQLYKKKKQKFKSDTESYVKQQKDEAAKLTTQATKNFDDLNDAQKKVWNTLDGKGWSTAKKIKYILGGGTLGAIGVGGVRLYSDVKKEMERAKGGYVKMNRGGEAKRKSSSSKKSRGTGAAIKGTKFKGVF